MSMVARAYNMRDTVPGTTCVKVYRVVVFYSVSKDDDIDVVDEGEALRETFGTLREAMDETNDFMTRHGGADMWDDLDGRMQSCWLPYNDYCGRYGDGDGYSVEFTAMMECVSTKELWRDRGNAWQNVGSVTSEQEMHLTVRRVGLYR